MVRIIMKISCSTRAVLCCALCAWGLSGAITSMSCLAMPAAQRAVASTRVIIEVTGGEKDAPVENASVYLKYVEERKIVKDKQFELNVKTNREGIAHIPAAPLGRVLIQIVAEGWKSFGRWDDVTGSKE